MDIWLFAATAAAGCIAKQLQNVTKGKGNILESSSEETVKQESPRRSLINRLARVKKPNENKFEDEKPSTSGESLGNYEDVHSDSLFLLPEFPEVGCGYWKTCGVLGGETELSSSFRQRRFVKPLSCMESCLMSRFHGEQMTMEEYMTSSFPSPRALDSRPLLVTDGSRVISKCTADSMWLNQQQMSLNEDKAACRNEKSKSRKHGLSDATVLLQIGISIGIMSSFMANQAKQELKQTENMVHDVGDELEMKDSLIGKEVAVEKAAESSESTSNIEAELKQTENVVHDVGDELEMKDSLIVKEVNTEKAGESLESISNIEAELKQTENVVHDVRDEVEMKGSLVVKEVDTEKAGESSESVSNIEAELKQTENMVHDVGDELEMKDSLKEVEDVEKAGESLESISNIEAELEAELERLEINMKTESNQDPSGNSTPESGNFAVSPRELSLRLHKVINSRLEKRITELETALQESQRKVEQLVTESESRKSSWSRVWEAREVMTYKSDSKTTEHTKTKVTNDAEMQPLVMNLKGEALDAFNESYDELMNLNDDSEDDDDESPVEMQESEVHHDDLSSASPLSHHQDDSKVQEQEQELVDFIGLEEQDEEENSDFESEMEKQLIKQIVEKTKQGSSVVLNAQKMLFLMEESEQNLKN